MYFGKQCDVLQELLYRSAHPNKHLLDDLEYIALYPQTSVHLF